MEAWPSWLKAPASKAGKRLTPFRGFEPLRFLFSSGCCKLPSMGEKHYAGIGTRKLAPPQRALCVKIGKYLAGNGWVLHTGAAPGADQAFARGALEGGGQLVLHLPWPSYEEDWFSKIPSQYSRNIQVEVLDADKRSGGAYDREAHDSVYDFHPAAERLRQGGLKLHARNYRILKPKGLPTPVGFCVAIPSPGGGGTAQGIRLSEFMKVPVVRLDQLSPGAARVMLDKLLDGSNGKKPDERDQDLFYRVLPRDYPDETTLAQARAYLKQGATSSDGIGCPCCGRLAKVYKRKLHTEMALFLIGLVKKYKENRDWVNIRDVIPGGDKSSKASSDGAYLVHWRLIEAQPKPQGGKKQGFYRPTERGIQFAEKKIRVPSHVALFDNKVVGWNDKLVYIDEALGDKFDYQELMRTAWTGRGSSEE